MKPVIAGNWKMHLSPDEALRFVEALDLSGVDARVLIFPTALVLPTLRESAAGKGVALGVQNVHWEPMGAFTGEISPELAAAAGAEWALVGHSERRHVFGETDAQVSRKLSACLRAGVKPIVCVGETIDERRAGKVEEVITRQLDAVLGSVSEETGWMIAYEPVWAIGTGETATPEDATSAHRTLRTRLVERFGGARAGRIPILYGGSVKPANAQELLLADEVDGVLVGGASLEPGSFAEIARAAG